MHYTLTMGIPNLQYMLSRVYDKNILLCTVDTIMLQDYEIRCSQEYLC